MNREKYLELISFLFLFSVIAMPGVQAGHLISNPMAFSFDLKPTSETDIITLTTNNDYDVDIQFIALNPANIPLPISSIIGFNTRIKINDNGFKWSYDLNLPNSNFIAKVKITSPIPVSILEDKYVIIDGALISFEDVLNYDYEYSLNQIDQYNVEYIITKDYLAHGINPNDPIVIDPSITTYPDNDGYLQRNNVGTITTFLTTSYLRAGIIDGEPDTNDFATRTYMRFTTEEIDYSDQIINATLRIYLSSVTTTGGQTCNAILESINDYEDLGSLDWNITGTVINSSFVLYSDSTGVYYEEDVSNYIEKEGITAFRIRGSYETYDLESCRFDFASNETINSPELEIYWIDIPENPNVTDVYDSDLGYPIYVATLFTTPIDPKISCNPDGSDCLALIYESNFFGGIGVKLQYSTDYFVSDNRNMGSIGETLDVNSTYYPYYHYPFDITFTNGKYWIVVKDKVYSYSIFQGLIFEYDADWTGQGSFPVDNWIVRFINDTYYLSIANNQQAGGADNALWINNVETDTRFSLTTGIHEDGTMSKVKGYADKQGSTIVYKVYWTIRCDGQAWCGGTIHENEFSRSGLTFSSDYLGFHHYIGGQLHYARAESEGIIEGIWKVDTSDYSSYTDYALIHDLDNSVSELIRVTDSVEERKRVFIWERYVNSGTSGIYIFTQDLKPVHFETIPGNTILATLENGTFETSYSGEDFILSTPFDKNKVYLQSPLEPKVYVNNFDFSGCNTPKILCYNAKTPYSYTFKIMDSLEKTPISGATIRLDGINYTTNSNGIVSIEINPITETTYSIDKNGCIWSLYADGTPLTYTLKVSKSGYSDYYISNFIPAKKQESGNIITWEFENNQTVSLDPFGVILDVHVFTSDNIEITPKSYNVSVSGNNDLTYTYINNKRTLRNWNMILPSKFLLYDNRTDYTVSVNLQYPGGSDLQNINVTPGNNYLINFYLPYTLLDLPCSTISDCSTSFCDTSGFHHELKGCNNAHCQYLTSDCFTSDLCDKENGCFAIETDISCKNDNQCLFDSNITYCIDYYSMYVGFCGTDGFCKQKEKVCTTFCNETIGYCNEKAQCLIPETIDVGYQWEGGSSIIHFVCTFENAGTDYCIQYGEISKEGLLSFGKTINNVYFTHEGFKITETDTGYKITDVVLSCSDTCEMGIEFCNSGECSTETDKCLNTAQSSDFGSMLWGGWLWVSGIVPVELRMLAWLLFTIFLMIWYKQETGDAGKSNDQSTLIVGFICLIAGFTIGWLHWILLLILGIGVALIIAQKIGQ